MVVAASCSRAIPKSMLNSIFHQDNDPKIPIKADKTELNKLI